MKDPVVQEVRDTRAAVVADFGDDLHPFFAWAKTHAAAERKAKHWLLTHPSKTLETPGGTAKSLVARQRGARPASVSD